MGRIARSLSLMAAVVVPLLFSCARPSSDEVFRKASERADDGCYLFNVAMDDSSYVYDISLIVPMMCPDAVFGKFEGFAAEVVLTSPSGKRFAGRLDAGRETVCSASWDLKTLCVPVAGGVVPGEYGLWTLGVYLPGEEDFGVTGVGMRLERIKKE
ncbi:MAG: hypothetical protein ACI4AE_02740 [Candidatus Cryptobacteroides sp.]